MTFCLETPRLLLREWLPGDLDPFATLAADSEVMRYFPKMLTREEASLLIARQMQHQAEHGFCFFAAELKESAECIGFIGLMRTFFEAHFTPCVEVGWRLAKEHWNQGLATEGAKRCLEFGFHDLKLEEIVSLTATQNLPSMRVMEKIGMKRDLAGDFDHPRVPEGHPLKRHVLYRKRAKE